MQFCTFTVFFLRYPCFVLRLTILGYIRLNSEKPRIFYFFNHMGMAIFRTIAKIGQFTLIIIIVIFPQKISTLGLKLKVLNFLGIQSSATWTAADRLRDLVFHHMKIVLVSDGKVENQKKKRFKLIDGTFLTILF